MRSKIANRGEDVSLRKRAESLRFIGHTSGRKVRTPKSIDLYSSEGNGLFNGFKLANGAIENYIAEREIYDL